MSGKKAVSIQMDESKDGCLEINITVAGKEVVLTKDGATQPDIKYEKNLQIIIRDPKAKSKKPNEKSKAPKPDPPQASTDESKA